MTSTPLALPKRTSSIWWIVFFLPVSTGILTSIAMIVLTYAVGFVFSFSEDLLLNEWTLTPIGLVVTLLVSLGVLWASVWNQAEFLSNRYEIPHPKKVALYATFFLILTYVVSFVWDWSEGYAWGWQECISALLYATVFYISSKRFLHS